MNTFKGMEDTLFNRTFRDHDGNMVLVRMPNLPSLTWFVSTFLALLIANDNIHRRLEAVAFGTLFTWA